MSCIMSKDKQISTNEYIHLLNLYETISREETFIISLAFHQLTKAIHDNCFLYESLDGFMLEGRIKSLKSAVKKLYSQSKSPDDLFDLIGIRVVLKPHFEKENIHSENEFA